MNRAPMKPRRKPIKRKAAKRTTRPRLPRCVWRRCDQPRRVLDLCRKHAMARADALARVYVLNRDKRCVKCGSTEALTWAHVIRRNAGRWLRHARYGAVTLCWPCHYGFTHDEAAWVDFLDATYGVDYHRRLRAIRNKHEYDNEALERTLLGYGYVPKEAK